jgi:hypothetical protein
MPDMIRELIKEHHAHYEVWPYYVLSDEGPGASAGSAHRTQAGFDIDIYGARTDNALPDSPKYELGHAELQKIAREISHHGDESCSVEVIPFPTTIFLDTKTDLRSQAMLRIRICHWRGLDQPAGPLEERIVKEIEKELQARGIRFGAS